MEAKEPLLTADELAREWRVSKQTIWRLVRQGKLPGRRILSMWRFDRGEIERWIERRTISPDSQRGTQ